MARDKLNINASPILLSLIIASVIEKIVKNLSFSEDAAVEKFYASKTYQILEDEEAKLWWLSSQTLFDIYKSEIETGKPVIPEGAF